MQLVWEKWTIVRGILYFNQLSTILAVLISKLSVSQSVSTPCLGSVTSIKLTEGVDSGAMSCDVVGDLVSVRALGEA